MTNIQELQPQSLWNYFYEITQIPRPSHHEEKIRAYLENIATKKNIKFTEDSVGNILFKIPATKGYENAPGVLLQSHVDMVAEKDDNFSFNFLTDPIPAYIDGEYIRTKGTTLGADNGIGMALSLAVLDEPNSSHGPLEILFTVAEETGLVGANNLNGANISAKYLLNLDSEEEGIFFIGCAGGAQVNLNQHYELVSLLTKQGQTVSIQVTNLTGGHSGLEIIKGRANASKLVAELLYKLNKITPCHLISFNGGTKHNAIPREATATVYFPEFSTCELDIEKTLAYLTANYQTQFKNTDPNLTVNFQVQTLQPSKYFSRADSISIIQALVGFPHGVLGMSMAVPGIVETSANLAIIKLTENKLEILISVRSSVKSAKESVLAQIEAQCNLANIQCTISDEYPAWTPDASSSLLKHAVSVWEQEWHKKPEVTAIHAGLECGIILEKCNHRLEAISFGPEMANAHTPKEELNIASTARSFQYLKKLLTHLATH